MNNSKTYQRDNERLHQIQAVLTTPLASSILGTHPNDLLSTGHWITDVEVSSEWRGWWDWAADERNDDLEEKWIKLVRYYNKTHTVSVQKPSDIPEDLARLINAIKSLQLDRTQRTQLHCKHELGVSEFEMLAAEGTSS
jgi:pullulanase/glycogen debranching enzyme